MYPSVMQSTLPPTFTSITKPVPLIQAKARPRNMPAPLTRPHPPPLATSSRQPLQPTRNQPSTRPALSTVNTKSATSASIFKTVVPDRPNSQPTTTSAFASAALARLPPPGKGASSSSNPISIRPGERAANLSKTRAIFERPSQLPSYSTRPTGIPRTVPIYGRTPGKASRQRAEQRELFDAMVRERIEEKEKERMEDLRLREEEEEEEYKRRRKKTVIWAKPVPSIYRATTGE